MGGRGRGGPLSRGGGYPGSPRSPSLREGRYAGRDGAGRQQQQGRDGAPGGGQQQQAGGRSRRMAGPAGGSSSGGGGGWEESATATYTSLDSAPSSPVVGGGPHAAAPNDAFTQKMPLPSHRPQVCCLGHRVIGV